MLDAKKPNIQSSHLSEMKMLELEQESRKQNPSWEHPGISLITKMLITE
jgi:hypothetical protein